MKNQLKRGRPKGRSRDTRSYGPLGDLMRKYRLEHALGLAEVAKACQCSVQFISNIEHGRAPLPWDKAESLAKCLKICVDDLRLANLAIRSDFRSFMENTAHHVPASLSGNGSKEKKVSKPPYLKKATGNSSILMLAAKDEELQKLIVKYQNAPLASKKRFLQKAADLLEH